MKILGTVDVSVLVQNRLTFQGLLTYDIYLRAEYPRPKTYSIMVGLYKPHRVAGYLLLMDKILHDPKDPQLWELWYIPYNA